MKKKGLLPFMAILACQTVNAQKQPNIILIMTDQQRSDALGCFGNDRIITPNIDSIASDGYLFTNAYTATPSSTPARAGLLTGMTPWHHGMLGYGVVAEHYRYEMPRMIRNCGYFTMGIGKMHWHPQNALHGFHVTLLDESGRREYPDFVSDYRKWFQTEVPGCNPDSTGIGWNDHGASAYKLPERLHPTVWTADMAVKVIENWNTNTSSPLFLVISFARPHSPYDPPQRILDMYDGIEMEAPAHGEWSRDIGKDITDPKVKPNAAFGQFGDEYAKNSKKHYYASITFIDEQVGRIINVLKKKGLYDDSIICFTSDHGDMMGDHNHWRKTYPYEGSTAIPYIVKFPASMKTVLPQGSEISNPVELRDFLPTFLDMAGGHVPEDMDGMSLVPLVQQKNPEWRKWIDMEHAACYSPDNYWYALTDGKIKYVWYFRTGKEQLFNLERDPEETRDLSKDTMYREELEILRSEMASHLEERGEDWVKDGKLVIRKQSMLYSPNYPGSEK